MRKLATLFTDSYHEFKYVRTITLTGMLGAVSVVLGYLTLELGETLKIGFSVWAGGRRSFRRSSGYSQVFGKAYGAIFSWVDLWSHAGRVDLRCFLL